MKCEGYNTDLTEEIDRRKEKQKGLRRLHIGGNFSEETGDRIQLDEI